MDKNIVMFGASSDKVNTLVTSLDPQTVRLLSEDLMRKYYVVPLHLVDNELTLLMADTHDLEAIDEIELQTGCKVAPVSGSLEQIIAAINKVFSVEKNTRQALIDMRLQNMKHEKQVQRFSLDQEGEDDAANLEVQPVVRLFEDIIIGAITQRASDIHLEPQEPEMRVRYRIDGVLKDVMLIPKSIELALVSRAKVLSDLDITEKRRPQDGHYRFPYKGKTVDIRVACVHTVAGEKVVMRILDKSGMVLDLSGLGFSEEIQPRLMELISRPYGMLIVTGPTGSGKTTTLYALLNMLDSTTNNIVTIEDPVEYRLVGINQTQVNPGTGLTFATGLKAFLRQDPNVIFVGEIRDKETAEIAVQAALTGHLVLTTLHTNDAPSAVARLSDLGIEPFLIASTLVGVVSQRLVRKLCVSCGGDGCDKCFHIGMSGRTPVYELMELDDHLRHMCVENATSSSMKAYMTESGMPTFQRSAMEKVSAGICSLEEIKRVVFF